jgi:hypothetical protein
MRRTKHIAHAIIHPKIPKNHARLVVSRPGTGTFIPHRPVTTFMGTIITVNSVNLPRRELMRLLACMELTER